MLEEMLKEYLKGAEKGTFACIQYYSPAAGGTSYTYQR
jgi:hypothetical protein